MCPPKVCSATIGDVCGVPCRTIKYYPIRPQGRSKDRQLVGTARYTHLDDNETLKFVLSASTGYNRSFKPREILEYLFGPDITTDITARNKCCTTRTIHIQGSKISSGRDPNAWLGDYFYLPRDFDGTVTFCPRISNFIMDFDLYVYLNSCMKGWYFRAYCPIVNAQWDLNMCESASLNAEGPEADGAYPTGYFTTLELPKANLVPSFTQYAAGCIPTGEAADTNDDYLVTFNPLRMARMTPFVCRETSFADLRFELGWNLLECNDHHIGLNMQAAAPSGKRRCPTVMFSPIIGNGRHWEFGSGLTAHYVFYKNTDETCQLAAHLDVNVTHIFRNREMRTFELRGKPNSAYMLAARYRQNDGTPPFAQLYAQGQGETCGNLPTHIFDLEYAPVANLTTLNVRVGSDLHADIVGMISLYTPRFTWDIGYNFWVRSPETIDLYDQLTDCNTKVTAACNPGRRDNMWALKGDTRMFGYWETDGTPQALSATESKADIHNGTNQVPLDFNEQEDINKNIDHPQSANICSGDPGPAAIDLLNQPAGDPNAVIKTSYQPVFISYEQLDLVGTRQMSHKIFTHLSFVCDRGTWKPYIGVGGFVELGRNKDCRSCYNDCPYNMLSRVDCALSQWGILFKTGIAFN